MADIGGITEIVNNEKLLLNLGGDTFILMQDCRFNLDRPISRQTTSGGGVVYFFGSGDNSIDFTLLLSTPIVATDVSGASKTITATGVLPHLEVQRMAGVGGIVFNGRIQLTGDTVTVA